MNKIWGVFIVLIIMVLFVMTLYWTRYQIVEVHQDRFQQFYKIDRLTGKIEFITGNRTFKVMNAEETAFLPAPATAPAPEQ